MTVTTTVRNDPPKVSTHELRALELYRRRGRDIQQIAPGVYRVPSQDGQRAYEVLYGALLEECPCPDRRHRGVNCVHILCVGIYHAKHRRPCCCSGGLVFVGHLVADEDGEEVEAFEAVPCRRCNGL